MRLANQKELSKARPSIKKDDYYIKCPFCSKTIAGKYERLIIAEMLYHALNVHSKDAFINYICDHHVTMSIPESEMVYGNPN